MTTHRPSSLELQALAVLWENGPSTVRMIRSRISDVFHGSLAGLVEHVMAEASWLRPRTLLSPSACGALCWRGSARMGRQTNPNQRKPT
jgi:hypothetical protein